MENDPYSVDPCNRLFDLIFITRQLFFSSRVWPCGCGCGCFNHNARRVGGPFCNGKCTGVPRRKRDIQDDYAAQSCARLHFVSKKFAIFKCLHHLYSGVRELSAVKMGTRFTVMHAAPIHIYNTHTHLRRKRVNEHWPD